MNQQEGANTKENRAQSDNEEAAPIRAATADEKQEVNDTASPGKEGQDVRANPTKERWKPLRDYVVKLREEGPDRHIELLLTIAIAFFAGCQLVITCSNNKSTTVQVNSLIAAADRIDDAADSFAGSAQHINRGVGNAVDKLQLQADQTQRSAQAAEDAVKATQTQMRLDQRAWVGFGNPNIVLNKTDPVKAETLVFILGKSPAISIVSTLGLVAFPVEHTLQIQDLRLDPNKHRNGTAIPGTSFPVNERISITPQERFIVDSILQKKTLAYFFGETRYGDIFKRPHWTHFCYVIPSADAKEMRPCDIYNDSDADQKK